MTSASARPVIVQPGDAIGILGGGQLGRMLAIAAAEMGLDVHIYAPENDCPASRVSARTVNAAYDDAAALKAFAAGIKVCTLEFENVPLVAVETLIAAGCDVRPGAKALSTAQDRLTEKTHFQAIGIHPAPFRAVNSAADIQPALDALGGKGILKTRRSGYDGKGQARLEGKVDANAAWAAMHGAPSILEQFVAFERELSVVLARDSQGRTAIYDCPQNIHEGGVLRRSIFPADLSADVIARARAMAVKLADSLDYVGVLALELFLTRDGDLIANEFAPRVHNSGHWTSDACFTGQFEQQIRAVCGWPLGDPSRHSSGEMLNLLGAEADDWSKHLAEGAKVHLYGKRDAAPGRKMGHVTKLTR